MSGQAPPGRDEFARFETLTTRWSDNDVYGHMNNAVHYRLFDTAVNGFLIGQGLLDIKAGDQVFLVVETGCRYFSEMAFPDVIHAGLSVAHLGNSSVSYRIGLFANDAASAAAVGQFVHVNVDRQTRRPVAISGRVREALEALMPDQQG